MPTAKVSAVPSIATTDSAEGHPRTWTKLGSVLHFVEQDRSWVGKASSFTEWVKNFAQQVGLTEASLWRYRAGWEFHLVVEVLLKARGFDVLPLGDGGNVSPEALELLAKLQRVMDEDSFLSIAARVMSGAITRAELRETWQTYRPALSGRTARGRGVVAPTVNKEDHDEALALAEAKILSCVRDSASTWAEIPDRGRARLFADVTLRDPAIGMLEYSTDAVLVAVRTDGGPSVFHGIEVVGNREMSPDAVKWIVRKSAFFDHFWIATDETPFQALPEQFGLLRCTNGRAAVERAPVAAASPKTGATGAVAKALLERLLFQ